MVQASNERFLTSTRGRIVALLRRGGQTVDELARTLGLTDNAVRAQLTSLERDGLIRQASLRRGLRKPSYTYEVAPEAESAFPKPYALVLGTLLAVAAEELGEAEVRALLRATGERLGAGARGASTGASRRESVALAVDTINRLGGLAEVTEGADQWVIEGYDCLFRSLLADHPDICGVAQGMLSSVTGAPVAEHCQRGERPRCRFEVPKPPADTEPATSPKGALDEPH